MRPTPAGIAVLAAFALALLASGCASKPPALAQEWYDIGNLWFDKKDWKKAGEAYAHALDIDPELSGASYNLARVLASSGDYRGALAMLDRLAKADPGNVRVASARAYALYKIGDPESALAVYREVLEKNPYSTDAVYNAAVLELASGDVGSAANHFELLSLAAPDDGLILLALGKARDRGGDTRGALESFERAKVLGKTEAAVSERMGEFYEKQRRYKEAMEAYEEAVKIEPGRAPAWFAFARLKLVVAADSERGLEALKKALDAGFDDRKAATALMDEPDLAARERAHEILKAKGLD